MWNQSFVHNFLDFQKVGKIPMKQFRDVITPNLQKECKNKFHNT